VFSLPPVYAAQHTSTSLKLHASDLRALSPSSAIATRVQDSPSSVQLPYVRLVPGADSSQRLADKIAQLCGAQHFDFPIGAPASAAAAAAAAATTETLDSGSKHVLCLSMPAVTESAGARKRSVAEHGAHYSPTSYKYAI
jgi:hypothetical protein